MVRNSGVPRSLVAFAMFAWLVAGNDSASAGPLYPGGLPHPSAIAGFSGTVQLQHDADNNPITLNQYYGDIEYSVFTAANFAALYPGEDNANGGVAAGEDVYAFQFINAGTRGDITSVSAGLADIGGLAFPNFFGDGLDDNEAVNPGDQDYIAGTGQAPSLSLVIASILHAPSGSSARFQFNDGTNASHLGTGEASAILYYTSPFGPRFDNGSTTTGQGQSRIPAPEFGVPRGDIPEPSSIALGSLCVLVLVGLRRQRGLD
jgi:hypothetical protein